MERKLFILYGYYRAVNKPVISVVLTVISLGSRVLLAYILSKIPAIGVIGIMFYKKYKSVKNNILQKGVAIF